MITLQTIEIERALAYFGEIRNQIVEVTDGLSEAQWKFKTAPDRWSVAEILEHMALAEERILGPIREQLAQAPPPEEGRDNHTIDAIVLERMPNRSPKAKAPAVIQPEGGWTRDAALTRVLRNYERLAGFVTSNPELRDHVLPSAPLKFLTEGEFQTMDGYQFALTAAAHDERHIHQIRDVKADGNYPGAAASGAAGAR